MLGEEAADRHDLAMRRRILLLDAEIVPTRQHLPVARDDGAERIVAARRLLDGKPHETRVFLSGKSLAMAKARTGDQWRRLTLETAVDGLAWKA